MESNISILILAKSALRIARCVQSHLGGKVHGLRHRTTDADILFDDTTAHIQSLFKSGQMIVGICSTGILIRTLAPVVSDKSNEPPVLAVSQDGKSIVPLLGGHHGANRMAVELAQKMSGYAFVTTASDTVLKSSLDEPPDGWVLKNPEDAKNFTAQLLEGKSVAISGEIGWLSELNICQSDEADLNILATEKIAECGPNRLVFHPKTLSVGFGCIRGCSFDEMEKLFFKCLQSAGLSLSSVSCIATIEIKADEPAICDLSSKYGLPLRLFGSDRLEQETHRLQNPSEIVFKEVGCHGVSESSALAASGDEGELIIAKKKTSNATCAIARSNHPIDPFLVGRSRGRLAVIGIGPGQDDWRTPEATKYLEDSDEIVGYGLYLELVKHVVSGKKCHDFPLGAEEKRVRFALELAAKGNKVALISSGDAGIYAMGALVYELLERPSSQGGVSDAAHRIEIINVPGITAFQAASARVGAPFGHDFCSISLSDLLTPWNIIEQRLKSAAEGDFAVALYNPVSKRRRTQLDKARKIFLENRPANTPVVIASNLGRMEENVRISTLEELSADKADMLTVILIGSSTSRITNFNGSQGWLYTPRGYEFKQKALKE